MTLNTSQVEKLLMYTGKMELSQLGMSMLITRLSQKYKADKTPQVLKTAADEINAFLQKYQSIMGKDYQWIIGL